MTITPQSIARHELREMLSESDARHRLLMASVTDHAIIVLDPQGTIVTWSEGARRLKGYEEAEIIGQPMSLLYPPEDAANGVPQRMLAIATAEGRHEDRGWRRRKDGSRFFADVVLSAMHDAQGQLVGFAKITRDITASVQAERRVRAQMEQAEALLQAAPDPVVIADREGRIVIVNARAETTFGYRRGEMVGRKVEMLLPDWHRVIGEARSKPYLGRPALLEMGAGGDIVARRSDGQEFAVDISLSPIAMPQGTLMISTIRDISERRRTEDQLRQAQKMEAIGNLTGGMAHDFNNLLSVITLNLEMALDMAPAGDSSDRMIEAALQAAWKGADLTRRLLDFARSKPQHPVRVDINEAITNIIRLLHRLIGEDIEIMLDLAPDTWPVAVDPAQLESSLANLATNARDAMPKGGQLVFATANRVLTADDPGLPSGLAPGDYALVEVRDTGSGMAPEVMQRIFEPFFTTKQKGKGTGLGLAMVFGFARQSGGHVGAESRPGGGTIFRILLPRTIGTEKPREPVRLRTVVRGAGETVLVVEDNIALQRIVVRQLSQLGYRVLEADRAATALEVLAQETVAILFTDVVMPGGLDGIELARMALERSPGLKIVLTSGFSSDRIDASGLPDDGWQMLTKPYRTADLAQAVRAALDG